MKKFIATVSTAALITVALASTVHAANKGFTDINGSYAKDAITELQAMGILTGLDDTHFAPKGTLTRAEFVTIIVRELQLPADATVSTFKDVSGWAVPFVEAAAKAGIIEGVGASTFSPNAKLTREEAATILVRALQLKGDTEDVTALDFKDAATISGWAQPYIAIAQRYGLIQGNPDGTFNPKGVATREMAATLGMNLLGALEKVTAPVVTPPVTTPVDPPVTTPVDPPVVTPPAGGGVYYPPTNGGGTTTPPVDPPVVTPPVVVEADLTAYNAALSAVTADMYTEESWTAYTVVVNANVVTKDNTQAEVDAATTAISAAQTDLVVKPVIPAPTVVSGVTIIPDGAGRVMLNFQLDKDLDLETGNVSIHFLDVNGNEVNGANGSPVVKDKSWSGYLNGVESLIKYGQGTEGDAHYVNILPANTVLDTVVTGESSYAGADWFNAISTIRVDVTDADGQATTGSVTMPVTISHVSIVPDSLRVVGLHFQLNQDIDLNSGDVAIRFLDAAGNDVLNGSGVAVVKNKTWSGYLTSGGANDEVHYSVGAEGADYPNVLPGATDLITLITYASSYAGESWYDQIATVQIAATDNQGNTAVTSVAMPAQ